jgi:hypothetical protein
MFDYLLLQDGGFVCGDPITRITAYAYPTSENAKAAKRHPSNVARMMLSKEALFRPSVHPRVDIAGYDARNWDRLSGAAV